MPNPAPFLDELAHGPEGGAAYWVHADDGIRVRVAVWPEGARGTVLLFPGRTEYVEKYGPAAGELKARGFATLTLDWRGQGMADRMLDDPMIGHVGSFADYQRDVRAALALADELVLPKPHYMIAHSMGGAIGLRSLYERLDVSAALFSAPMWEIRLPGPQSLMASVTARLARAFRFADRRMPMSTRDSYVLNAPFEDNLLTHDPDMYAMMQIQTRADARLGLAGPSIHWLAEARRECAELMARDPLDLPIEVHLGTEEAIVATGAITTRTASWPRSTLVMVPGACHEVMMELPAARTAFFDAADALFRP